MIDNVSRKNAQNTINELMAMGVIPIVNENDTVSTYEIRFGDNDTLSAIVSALTGADLLILLSDIDGLYTDDPKVNPDAELITYVEEFSPEYMEMASSRPDPRWAPEAWSQRSRRRGLPPLPAWT